MHEHDLDLIAAAAAGDPDADQATAARLVAGCDECRREWEAQRTAMAALAAAPPVVLDDLERARLHRRVAAELEADTPSTTRSSAQVSPFTRRVLAVAGAAAVVVAVLGVGSLLRGGTTPEPEQMTAEAGADLTNGDETFDTAADTAILQDGMQTPEAGGAEATGGAETTAAAASADTTNRTASRLAATRLPKVPPSRLPAQLTALRDGNVDPDLPTEVTALSCVDRVGQDRPGSEIELAAVLAVGDDQVEIYVTVDTEGKRSALAYRTADCVVIARR